VAGTSLMRRITAPLARIADFGGRTRRADHWPYMVMLFAIYVVGSLITIGLFPFRMGSPVTSMYLLTVVLALLALATTVRRLHDVGWSGLWMVAYVSMMLGFVALYFYWRYAQRPPEPGDPSSLFRLMPLMMMLTLVMNGLGLLVLVVSVLEGTVGPNRYGPDPKGRSAP
jgi:uncharacterized membrane protein YhaH (DUF805 family)